MPIAPKGYPPQPQYHEQQPSLPTIQPPHPPAQQVSYPSQVYQEPVVHSNLQPVPIPNPQPGYGYHFAASHVEVSQGRRPSFANHNHPSVPAGAHDLPVGFYQQDSTQSDTDTAIQTPPPVGPETNSLSPEDWQNITPPSTTAENGNSLASQYPQTEATVEAAPVFADYGHTLVYNEEEEDDEDDPWDVMDEEPDYPAMPSATVTDLQLLSRVRAQPMDLEFRSFHTFLNAPNVLARYRPKYTSSPVTDEKTARIFAHFLSATALTISVFERSYANNAALLSGVTLPLSQQSLWTYKMPALALENPTLMHALVALGALHIAKLQETSEDPSRKHFGYALRRVGKLIGLPQRRNEVPTLAANLLLAYYEVMTGEHSKWSIHLNGVKILIAEIDFSRLTRMIRNMRDQAKSTIATMSPPPDMLWRDIWRSSGYPENLLDPKDWEVDDQLVSELTGTHVQFHDPYNDDVQALNMTEQDIEDYKTRSDLFWWFCKQDLFSAMLSGNDLILPYTYWSTNPPRAQFGRIDAAYGTFDHLVLLLGRLLDFCCRDRPRKVRAMAATGGQWRPPPGFFTPGPGPPGAGRGGPPAGLQETRSERPPAMRGPPVGLPSGPLPQMPQFQGMLPQQPARMESDYATVSNNLQDPYRRPDYYPQEARAMPQNFGIADAKYHFSTPEIPPPSPSKSELDILTEQALAEHASISKAFELFFNSLPLTFAPLTVSQSPPISTPFGPALQYRTHIIACIHMFYNCGLLLLNRFHPHMPPAAMVATGISAFKTSHIANTIGRISGSLYSALDHTTARMATPNRPQFRTSNQSVPGTAPPKPVQDLNPSLGAVLTESTFPFFFAAVQYTDPAQREWTISKLRTIARCTGWHSSAAIAAGCETAWLKMAAARGPPASAPPQGAPPMQQPFHQGPPSGGPPGPSGPPRSNPSQLHDIDNKDPRMEEQKWLNEAYLNMRPLGPLWKAAGSSSPQSPGVSVSDQGSQTPDSRRPSAFDFSSNPHHEQYQQQQYDSRQTSTASTYHPDSISRLPSIAASTSSTTTSSLFGETNRALPTDEETPLAINHDRRYIGTNPNARVHWALGILGVDQDLSQMNLDGQSQG